MRRNGGRWFGCFLEMSRLQRKQESRPILLRLLPAEIRKKQFKFSIRAVDRPSTRLGFLFGFEACPDLIRELTMKTLVRKFSWFIILLYSSFKMCLFKNFNHNFIGTGHSRFVGHHVSLLPDGSDTKSSAGRVRQRDY